MNIRVLCCGDRNWTDFNTISYVIAALVSKYGQDIAIIHGAASGADTIAGKAALNLQLVTVAVPAKWDRDGKSAGPIRNRYMLNKCKPHLVIAFHPDLWNSKGTKHMVGIASEAGIPVIHIDGPETARNMHDELPESLHSESSNGRTAGRSGNNSTPRERS